MKQRLDATSVVLAGAWNLSIFKPEWVAEHVFGDASIRPPVTVSLLSTGSPSIEIPFRDIALLKLVAGRLEVRPQNPEESSLLELERIALAALTALPETPIGGVGINFGYSKELATENEAQLIEFKDTPMLAGVEFATESWLTWRQLKRNEVVLHVQMQKWPHEPGRILIDINRHFDVTGGNARAAAALLKDSTLSTYALIGTLIHELDRIC